jgi:hypothetical protein
LLLIYVHDSSEDIHELVIEDDLVFSLVIFYLLLLFLFLEFVVAEDTQVVHEVTQEANDNKNDRAKENPEGDEVEEVSQVRLGNEVYELSEVSEGEHEGLVGAEPKDERHVFHPEYHTRECSPCTTHAASAKGSK